ncbi:MAG: hypothetical protein ACLPLP_26285, partial [Mycobacterium sp.]
MTALNDSERAAHNWTAARPDRPAGMRPTQPAETTSTRISRYHPAWLPSRRFIAAVVAIGGMQLLATMDSTVAIVALPKIQNELASSAIGSDSTSRLFGISAGTRTSMPSPRSS